MTSTAELSSPDSADATLTRDMVDPNYTLANKYTRTSGRIYLSGMQALVRLPMAQIRRTIGTYAIGLRGCVHTDEDDVRLMDGLADLRAEVEVSTTCLAHDFIKAGFIHGERVGVPGGDALGIEVHDVHADVRAFGGDHRHGGSADVAGADATDAHSIEVVWGGS